MLRDTGGAALIEFALVSSLLVLMLLPLVDVGMGFYRKTQVMTAAEAGAQYAFVNSSFDSTKIIATINSATTLSGMTAGAIANGACGTAGFGPTGFGCANGTTITYSATSVTCASGETSGKFATTSATVTYRPLFNYAGFGSSVSMNACSTVRYQ
jgi:Flp pilus assembly protein TadG